MSRENFSFAAKQLDFFSFGSRLEIIHADWPAYPRGHGFRSAVAALSEYPALTRFCPVDHFDGCTLFKVAKADRPRKGRSYVAVWDVDLAELSQMQVVDGISVQRGVGRETAGNFHLEYYAGSIALTNRHCQAAARSGQIQTGAFSMGVWEIDFENGRFSFKGKLYIPKKCTIDSKLEHRHLRLLKLLVMTAPAIVTKKEIMKYMWPEKQGIDSRRLEDTYRKQICTRIKELADALEGILSLRDPIRYDKSRQGWRLHEKLNPYQI